MQYAEGGGKDNNNLYKKMPKPMLHKLGSLVRKHLEVRERERGRRKRKQRTLALQKHRPNEERRGG